MKFINPGKGNGDGDADEDDCEDIRGGSQHELNANPTSQQGRGKSKGSGKSANSRRRPKAAQKPAKSHECKQGDIDEVQRNGPQHYCELMTEKQAAAWVNRPMFKEIAALGDAWHQWRACYRVLYSVEKEEDIPEPCGFPQSGSVLRKSLITSSQGTTT
jgi:hypothetical protein